MDAVVDELADAWFGVSCAGDEQHRHELTGRRLGDSQLTRAHRPAPRAPDHASSVGFLRHDVSGASACLSTHGESISLWGAGA